MKSKNSLTEEIIIDNLIRSNRRSISLEIRGTGELIVRAPLRLADSSILDIVRKKAEWIKEKQKNMKERELSSDNEIYFLGQKLNVVKTHGERSSVFVDENSLFITLPKHRTVEALLSRWYKKKTLEIIIPRTLQFAKKFQLEVKKFSISNAKSRWGSCNKKGSISFSFRLIMLPLETINYIIIHELAHLVEPNHSKQFWGTVQKMMPEYKQHETWLKHNSYKFHL